MKTTRREFIQTMAAASLGPMAISVRGEASVGPDGLPRRVLGKTNVPVTILGLGGAWLSLDKTARQQEATESHARAVIDAAIEGGIRYFDTAPNYHLSEERLGAALASIRDKVFLVTKLDHADAANADKDLAASLRRLKTDHVDLLLLHVLGLEGFDDFAASKSKKSEKLAIHHSFLSRK